MNKWVSVALLALLVVVFFMAGRSITGNVAGMPETGLADCSLGARIGFMSMGDEVQACIRGNTLHFSVENLGAAALDGLSMRVESGYAVNVLVDGVIPPGGLSQQAISFGAQGFEGPVRLRVAPVLGSGKVICAGAEIETGVDKC